MKMGLLTRILNKLSSVTVTIDFEIYALCFCVNIPYNQLHFQALNLKNQSDATEDGDNAETWTLEELFLRRPDLDAVVDLTNTNRYYVPRDMERAAPKGADAADGGDFAHFKIFTQGHEVPNRDVVRR